MNMMNIIYAKNVLKMEKKMNNSEVEEEMNKSKEWIRKRTEELGLTYIEYKHVAIGYLELTKDYQKGIVSQIFINKLKQIWNNGSGIMSLGHHDCDFCIDEGNYENRA